MAIRMTQNQMNARFDMDRNAIFSAMADSQRAIGDGLRIAKPSDDPFGAGQVMDFNAQIGDVQKYQSAISDSRSMMDAEDSALDTVTQALQQIRAKTLQALNGTNGTPDMQSIAQEIAQLKETIRDGLNAKYGDQYLFSGTATSVPPFPAPAVPGPTLYGGTFNVMNQRIGQNQSVAVNAVGTTIAGPDGMNVFDDIEALVADIQAGNRPNIQNGLSAIQADTDRVLSVRTQLGASAGRLELLQNRLARTEETLSAARSTVRDADTAKTYTKFTQQQQMYQAALAAGTRMMQTSILDFIR